MIRVIKGYSIDDITASMQNMLRKAALDENVRNLAVQITARSDNPVQAIWTWVKEHVTYVSDPAGFEQFTSPSKLVENYLHGIPVGEDCDSHAMLVTALCRAIGLNAHVIIVGYQTSEYDHAFTQVWSEKLNAWLDVDTTTDKPLGWVYQYKSQLEVL